MSGYIEEKTDQSYNELRQKLNHLTFNDYEFNYIFRYLTNGTHQVLRQWIQFPAIEDEGEVYATDEKMNRYTDEYWWILLNHDTTDF